MFGFFESKEAFVVNPFLCITFGALASFMFLGLCWCALIFFFFSFYISRTREILEGHLSNRNFYYKLSINDVQNVVEREIR